LPVVVGLLGAVVTALASLPIPLPWRLGIVATALAAGLTLIYLTREALKKAVKSLLGALIAGMAVGLLTGHFLWHPNNGQTEHKPALRGGSVLTRPLGPPPDSVVTVLMNEDVVAATTKNLAIVLQIYAPDAFVKDAACQSPGQSTTWRGLGPIKARYRALPGFASLGHEFAQVRFTPDTSRAATATATAQTVGFIKPSATSPTGQYIHGDEVWTFARTGGRWLITSFTYNVCYPAS